MPRGSLAFGKSVVEKMTCRPGSTSMELKISAGIAAPRAAQSERYVPRPFEERLFTADHFSSRAQPRSDVPSTSHGAIARKKSGYVQPHATSLIADAREFAITSSGSIWCAKLAA